MHKTLIILTTLALTAGGYGFASASPAGDAEGGHLMVEPEQLEWAPVGSMPPGATVAVLEGDPSQDDAFTMRIRFPENYVIPVHTHPAVERVTVLEGTLYLGVGETFDRDAAEALTTGTLAVMDAGVPMYGYTGDEPAVIQLNGHGPWGIEYVNPEDDPRR